MVPVIDKFGAMVGTRVAVAAGGGVAMTVGDGVSVGGTGDGFRVGVTVGPMNIAASVGVARGIVGTGVGVGPETQPLNNNVRARIMAKL